MQASSLSLKRSAMAIILILVFADIDLITAVPRPPHPIIPILTAELACDPNAVAGLRIVTAESAAVFCRKSLLFISVNY